MECFSPLSGMLGEGRSLNSWEKERVGVPPHLHSLDMHYACNRERNVLLAGAQQKGW